jgi:hypothetical protein
MIWIRPDPAQDSDPLLLQHDKKIIMHTTVKYNSSADNDERLACGTERGRDPQAGAGLPVHR